jgi:signal transduction histidine kinase
LAWLAEQLQGQYGIPCRFEDDGQPKPVGDNLRGVLFRAAREVLHNVAKHAQARQVSIRVQRGDGRLRVTIEDDGIGFDATSLAATAGGGRGFGLFNIRERLAHLGGCLEIQSAPGQGTRIVLVAPLSDAPDQAIGA